MTTAGTDQFLTGLKSRLEGSGRGAKALAVHSKAAEALSSFRMPAEGHEDWRYTRLFELARMNFPPVAAKAPGYDVNLISSYLSSQDINVVIWNGSYVAKVPGQSLPTGASLLSGEAALDAVAQGKLTPNDAEWLIRLNELHSEGPVFLDIQKGIEIAPLIHVIHVADKSSSGKAIFPRLDIRLGRGAKARILETSILLHEQAVFVDSIHRVSLAEEASLERVQYYRGSAEEFRFLTTHIEQAKDSRFHDLLVTEGARIFRNNLSVFLEGEGAESTVNGLHHLNSGLHADSHTYVEHVAPNARSNQLYKCILDGEAHSVFNGRIHVRRDAQLTNSYQLNKNLLLSREARVDTKPQLEIFADDVKCTHGATIGQLDEDQLFYLNTRGIDTDSARRMLIRGFTDDIVNTVLDPEMRARLIKVLG